MRNRQEFVLFPLQQQAKGEQRRGAESVWYEGQGQKQRTYFCVALFVVAVVFFYPVASQVSMQLVLMHSGPADLDHRAVDYLHGHVLRGSRGNCTGKKQASESWEKNN